MTTMKTGLLAIKENGGKGAHWNVPVTILLEEKTGWGKTYLTIAPVYGPEEGFPVRVLARRVRLLGQPLLTIPEPTVTEARLANDTEKAMAAITGGTADLPGGGQ